MKTKKFLLFAAGLLLFTCIKGQTSNPGNTKLNGNNFINVAPCVNEDFEATPVGAYTTSNAVNGWTITRGTNVSSCGSVAVTPGSPEFSIVATPIAGFPGVGVLPNSPFGGSRVARLNNYAANNSITKIATSFPVTASNSYFQFAFAGYASNVSNCCDGPGFNARIITCNSVALPCGLMQLSPSCSGSGITYTNATTSPWTSWQVRYMDLTPYIGSCVTFEFWCSDNTFGSQYACAAFDAQCSSAAIIGSGIPGFSVTPNPPYAVNYCAGSATAQITTLAGYTSYSWMAPAGAPAIPPAQATFSTLTITNPVPNSVYTVNFVSTSGCPFTATYAIVPSQVAVTGYGSSPACPPAGNIGSATVQATGSSVGYNYSWTNSTSSVVGTSSVASGLAAGLYSVTVSAPGYTACGSALQTVSVGFSPPPPAVVNRPYCGNTAYLVAPSGSSNFQWYNNTAPILAPLGTAPSFTINGAGSGAIFRLGHTTNAGCRDSIIYNFSSAVSPGALSAQTTGNGCYGTSSATAVIGFTPTPNSTASSYSVSVAGAAYAFSTTISPSAPTLAVPTLTSGSVYTVTAFDGNCYSNSVFTVVPLAPLFTFTTEPQGMGPVCSGSSFNASLAISNQTSATQYSFFWTPSAFLSTGSFQQNPVITPTTAPGTTTSLVYTVFVIPSATSCAVTNTYAIVISNPPAPSIAAIPSFCFDSPDYTVSASPGGGTFNPVVPASGIITPSLLPLGANSVVYSISQGTCISSVSSDYTVYPLPVLNVTGNASVCAGNSVALMASGADTYLWSNQQIAPGITVSPPQSTTYSVTGTNTVSNCQSSQTLFVNVIALPILTVSASQTLCAGQSTTLNVSGAGSYTWDPGANSSATLSISPAASTNYTVTGLSAQTGCSNSKTVAISVSPCAGIVEDNTMHGINIYPNPSRDNFTLENSAPLNLAIYNGIGMLVYQRNFESGKHGIDLSEYSPGIYFAVCESKTDKTVIRLVKTD